MHPNLHSKISYFVFYHASLSFKHQTSCNLHHSSALHVCVSSCHSYCAFWLPSTSAEGRPELLLSSWVG